MSKREQQWTKYVLDSEHNELNKVIKIDEEIIALSVKLKLLKEARRSLSIISRCNLRAWRAKRRKKK